MTRKDGTGTARALRRRRTNAEAKLWFALRNRQLDGWKFKRIQVIYEGRISGEIEPEVMTEIAEIGMLMTSGAPSGGTTHGGTTADAA